MTIGQALAIYANEGANDLTSPERAAYAIDALDPLLGDLAISEIDGQTCRKYLADRGVSPSTVRRELGVLQSALAYCKRERLLAAAPDVWRPPETPPVERWLTRQEAAWLLRAARQLRKDGRHLADFILCGIYTGTRRDSILALHIDEKSPSGGYIDTEHGILYRRPPSTAETNKRRRPARLPRKYLNQIRRQKRNGRRFVVQDCAGNRVASIRKGWARAVQLAEQLAAEKNIELDLTQIVGGRKKYITPHVLKHTAITWALQNGSEMWDAAGYFSTSVDTLERVYGHHSPMHQESTVRALDGRRK